jgi:hypothetical protein
VHSSPGWPRGTVPPVAGSTILTAVLVVAVVRNLGGAVAQAERHPADHDGVVDGELVGQTARSVPILTRSRIDASGR